MASGSLNGRLLALAAVWVTAALVIAGIFLTDLFRRHAEADLARRMGHQLDELAAALEVGTDGRLAVSRDPGDPRFHRPLSGLYWQVMIGDTEALRSRSLWDQTLALPVDRPESGELHRHELTGPGGERLVAWERALELSGIDLPVRVAVIADAADVQAATADFSQVLALSLAILAAGLMAAALAQVRLGLVPLRRMRAALAELRTGNAVRLEGRFPDEVQPLADDLNQLLAENAGMVERARAEAADLAHALKTPLAVIANAVSAGGPEAAGIVAREADRMQRQIERHLARARAVAAGRTLGGGSTAVLAALRPLAAAVERLHADRGIRIELAGDPAIRVRADIQDLQEMAGNLIDNAAKWGRTLVRVGVVQDGAHASVTVEDDGPGIPAARRTALPERGRRLDETVPGTGLGLAITDELVRLHGGALRLGDSPLGGLRATLDLPAAPAPSRGTRS